jgi:integrase
MGQQLWLARKESLQSRETAETNRREESNPQGSNRRAIKRDFGEAQEPYATLVLCLAATGLRISEALAIKCTDFENNVLHVTRRIYDGDVDTVKSKRSDRKLPIDPILMARMEKLGKGEWVFRSRTALL